jgi:hypothetical protein
MNSGRHSVRSSIRWAVAVLAVAGCGQILGIEAIEPAGACASSADCDDANPCTADSCGTEGVCVHQAAPDGVAEQQMPGDCARVECAAGSVQSVPDATDVPGDHNACTDDRCDPGPDNVLLDDGTPCDDGAGHTGACVAGTCTVQCTAANAADVCNDGNACTTDTCDLVNGVCSHAQLSGVPAPEALQTTGDCQLLLCMDGQEQPTIDNADVPVDGSTCTEDLCSSGVPQNPPLAYGSPCSEGSGTVCNATGECVECNAPIDCTGLPQDDDCQQRTCTGGVCGQQFTANNTPIPAQTPGDCHQMVCDGTGSTASIPDDADLPTDGNDCTGDLCTNGVPSHPSMPVNFPCGPGGTLYCNGSGQCLGCTLAAQCGADSFCLSWSCTGGNCIQNYTANGTPLPSGQQITGDCQQLQCNGTGGTKSVADNNDLPADDGQQCTSETCSNGSPAHPPRALNYACTQNGGAYCDGTGSCVACNSANQCPPPGPACKVAACTSHTCGSTNVAAGTPLPAGQQVTGDCQLLVCDGSGGTTSQDQNSDVPVDGNQCTDDVCTSGTPSNPPSPPFSVCSQGGTACDGAGNCVPACGLRPASPGVSCPAACTGGCASGVCTIACNGSQCQSATVNCPAGWACNVQCTVPNACRNATINCPPIYACDVTCANGHACEDGRINCSANGYCDVTCGPEHYDCHHLIMQCGSNTCDANCVGSVLDPQRQCNGSCSCTGC